MSDDHKAPHGQLVNLLREEEENLVKRYLLGEADEREQQQIEERLLTEDAYAESLLLIEDELIDDYARRLLSAHDRELFELNFLTTPKRLQKLTIAQSLVLHAATENITMPNREATTPEKKNPIEKTEVASGLSGIWHSLFFPPWKLAAYGFLLLVIGFGAWRIWFKPSEISQGLIALNQAYRQQRPLESRITGFDYAPFIVTRGEEKTGDYVTLDEAEVMLRKAAREKNDAESLRSLGRLYLAKKEFDKAIEQLDQALKTLPAVAQKDAQLHNDLGTALLEKSHVSKRRGDEQQSALEIGRSLDELNKAVEANPNLLEAVFNRALCRQIMGLQNQAIAGWNEYLQKDSNSRWAEEARQHLQSIEEQRKKVAGMKDRAYDDFVAAYQTRDEAKAWEAFKIARNRNGSSITNRLIDDWMALVPGNQNDEADTKLRLLEFGGEIERKHTGEKFTTDQAAYYRQRATRNFIALSQARQIAKEAENTYNQAKLEAAHDLYTKASKLFRTAGNEPEALFCESWMGYCQTRLSDVTESFAIFDRLVAVYRSKSFKSLLAYSEESLADIYTIQNEVSKALDCEKQSLKTAEGAENYTCSLRSQQNMQGINHFLGKYEEALLIGQQGIRTVIDLPVEPRQAWGFYSELSLNLLKLAYPNAAMEAQQEAFHFSNATNWPLYKSLSWIRIATICDHLGKFNEAIRYAELSKSEAKNIPDDAIRSDTLADIALYTGHLLRRNKNYYEAIRYYTEAKDQYAGKAFQLLSQKAQEGRFLAKVANQDFEGATRDLTEVYQQLEKTRGHVNEESNVLSFFGEEQEFYDTATDFAYTTAQNPNLAFELTESTRARAFLSAQQVQPHFIKTGKSLELKLPSLGTQMSLTTIQDRLPQNTQLLEYSILSDKVIIWLISHDSFFLPKQKSLVSC